MSGGYGYPSAEQDFPLSRLLELRELGDDRFSADFTFSEPFTLFGGQILAQALLAAQLTAGEDRRPHSVHLTFVNAGDPEKPTEYRVRRIRDGRTYVTRAIDALQDGVVIAVANASFARPELGIDEQSVRLDELIPTPELSPELPRLPRVVGFEGRGVPQTFEGVPAPLRLWARCTETLEPRPGIQEVCFAYFSDLFTGLHPYAAGNHAPGSSLDHTVWFHRPFDVNDWFFVNAEPRTAHGGRGLYQKGFFDRDGRLIASAMQEALFREVRPTTRPLF